MLGGVPDVVGGGGLENQIRETLGALRELGIDAQQHRPDPSWQPHLIHAFGADPATWNHLKNSAVRVPLVLSPVLVIESRLQRQLLGGLTSRRFGVSTSLSMRAELIRAAAHVVALNQREAHVLTTRFGVDAERMSVVGNGSRATASASRDPQAESIVCVGTVGTRKAQFDLVSRWPAAFPELRIIGSVDATFAQADEFFRAVSERPNITYVGPLAQELVWREQRRALATISNSSDEGQSLALLDSVALGRPVLIRESASGRALMQEFPTAVRLIPAESPCGPTHIQWARSAAVSGRPLTWAEVAQCLREIYGQLLGS